MRTLIIAALAVILCVSKSACDELLSACSNLKESLTCKNNKTNLVIGIREVYNGSDCNANVSRGLTDEEVDSTRLKRLMQCFSGYTQINTSFGCPKEQFPEGLLVLYQCINGPTINSLQKPSNKRSGNALFFGTPDYQFKPANSTYRSSTFNLTTSESGHVNLYTFDNRLSSSQELTMSGAFNKRWSSNSSLIDNDVFDIQNGDVVTVEWRSTETRDIGYLFIGLQGDPPGNMISVHLSNATTRPITSTSVSSVSLSTTRSTNTPPSETSAEASSSYPSTNTPPMTSLESVTANIASTSTSPENALTNIPSTSASTNTTPTNNSPTITSTNMTPTNNSATGPSTNMKPINNLATITSSNMTQTNNSATSAHINTQSGGSSPGWLLYVLIVCALIVLSLIVGFIVYRYKKRKSSIEPAEMNGEGEETVSPARQRFNGGPRENVETAPVNGNVAEVPFASPLAPVTIAINDESVNYDRGGDETESKKKKKRKKKKKLLKRLEMEGMEDGGGELGEMTYVDNGETIVGSGNTEDNHGAQTNDEERAKRKKKKKKRKKLQVEDEIQALFD